VGVPRDVIVKGGWGRRLRRRYRWPDQGLTTRGNVDLSQGPGVRVSLGRTATAANSWCSISAPGPSVPGQESSLAQPGRESSRRFWKARKDVRDDVVFPARFLPSLRTCLARVRCLPLLAATPGKTKSGDQETSTSLRHKNPRLGRKNDLGLTEFALSAFWSVEVQSEVVDRLCDRDAHSTAQAFG
jgi:hypothetical protein